MAPNDGERKAGRFRTQCGCPRPSEVPAWSERELERRHPAAGGRRGLIGNGAQANALKAKSSVDGECNTSVNDRSISRRFLGPIRSHASEPHNVYHWTVGPEVSVSIIVEMVGQYDDRLAKVLPHTRDRLKRSREVEV